MHQQIMRTNKRQTHIYRLELKNRKDIINIRPDTFEKILTIPNLEGQLSKLPDNETRNKVFNQFLDFFLTIRVAGMSFENEI
jgi:hypothetical protein